MKIGSCLYTPVKYNDDLTNFRYRSKLTQKQLADALGISRSALQKYEYGLRKPRGPIQSRINELMKLYA